MATIKQTRAAIKKRREAEAKVEAARVAAEKAKNTKPVEEKDESILDSFRKFFSTDDSSADAIAAIESGIADADAADKDK